MPRLPASSKSLRLCARDSILLHGLLDICSHLPPTTPLPPVQKLRRVATTPDPDTFEKYRDTPPISIAILLQNYALLLAESSIYTTNLYHDTPPICITHLYDDTFAEVLGSGVIGTLPRNGTHSTSFCQQNRNKRGSLNL